MAVIRLACVGTISNKAMSKNGSEDVVMEEQGDGPATAMAPSPGYGSIKIRHILERVSPTNVMEYRALLDEAGFDTLESLTLPYSEFKEEVTGIKFGACASAARYGGRGARAHEHSA